MMSGIVDRLRASLRRAAIASFFLLLALLLAFAAMGFGIAALYRLLEGSFSPEGAAAITAGILLVGAGVMGLVAIALLRSPAKPAPKARSASTASKAARPGAGDPSQLARGLMAGGTWSPLTVAVIAGFAFGVSPEIRREAARLLRKEADRL
ncbi:hypothetical protein [Aquibaculum sediminis]|uniref:hypothetical protein n=1 Tax=Aquibaculum sediminis TaxID=3231907 RepID=UPI003457374C